MSLSLDPTLPAAEEPHIERLFVVVGADPVPFSRLLGWVDRWLTDGPVGECVAQRGTAAPMTNAVSTDYLLRDELEAEAKAASAMICDGSVDMVRLAHRNGLRPIIIARQSDHDEVADSDQVLAARLHIHKQAVLVESYAELDEALLAVAREPAKAHLPPTDDVAAINVQAAESTGRASHGPRSAGPGGRVTMLYVGGVGRSGSTLLNDLLGQHDDVVAVGELVHLFQRGLVENNLCGCGERFNQCEFWTEVGEMVAGGWDKVSGEELIELKESVDRNRFAHALLAPRLFRSIRDPLKEWGSFYESLIRSAVKVSGRRVLVDSTKQVSTGLLLHRIPGVDLRVLHLVRDPRGVAYSWTKKKRKVEVVDTDAMMNRYHPATMAWRWLSWNLVFAAFRLLRVPVLKVHYEDLIENPVETLSDILTFGGLVPGELGFIEHNRAQLESTHSVAGNPSRFDKGAVTLTPDEEWRENLEPAHRRLVTAITSPLLRWYGYIGKGR